MISPARGSRYFFHREIDTFFEGPSNVSIHGYISLSPANAARNGAERGLAISRFPPPSILLSSSITDRVAQNVRFEILNPFFPTPPISSIFASRSLRLCYDNHVCRFRAPLALGLAAPLCPFQSSSGVFTKKTFRPDVHEKFTNVGTSR